MPVKAEKPSAECRHCGRPFKPVKGASVACSTSCLNALRDAHELKADGVIPHASWGGMSKAEPLCYAALFVDDDGRQYVGRPRRNVAECRKHISDELHIIHVRDSNSAKLVGFAALTMVATP